MTKVENFNLAVTTTLNTFHNNTFSCDCDIVHTYNYIHSKIEYLTDKIDEVESIATIIRRRLPF